MLTNRKKCATYILQGGVEIDKTKFNSDSRIGWKQPHSRKSCRIFKCNLLHFGNFILDIKIRNPTTLAYT